MMEPSLADLFVEIDGATEANAALVISQAARALEGDAGLAILRDAASVPFVRRGLTHQDSRVRELTIAQLMRLATTPADVTLLRERGLLAEVAGALGDGVLHVAQRAAAFLTACAMAGAATLELALADDGTQSRLASLVGGDTGSVVELRALDTFAAMAASGDTQFALMANQHGLLARALALWRGADPLVRLNAVEIFGVLARCGAGFTWLHSHGVLREMLACVDGSVGDDPLVDLQRPIVLGCLGALLETGGGTAQAALLTEAGIVRRLWPLLSSGVSEQVGAALAVLRAAATTTLGATAIVAHLSSEPAAAALAPLAALMRAHDERTRIGALSVAAQLLTTHASDLGATPPTPVEVEATADATAATSGAIDVTLQSLVRTISPTASTTTADAVANGARSVGGDLRLASYELLVAMAHVEWGATELTYTATRFDPTPPGWSLTDSFPPASATSLACHSPRGRRTRSNPAAAQTLRGCARAVTHYRGAPAAHARGDAPEARRRGRPAPMARRPRRRRPVHGRRAASLRQRGAVRAAAHPRRCTGCAPHTLSAEAK